MLAFSPFFPSNWEWENNLTLISSSLTKFDDDSNNNYNRNRNNTLKSEHELAPLPPLFQALDGENAEIHMMSKSQKAQYHMQQNFDGAGLGQQELINSCSTDHKKGGNEHSLLTKRLNHNTRERDRRKRMNAMYSSLRSLLPASVHHKDELSIPETISLVVDYVPKLQKELQNLIGKKEEIASKISALQGIRKKSNHEEEKVSTSTNASWSSSCSISIKKLGDREIVIHTSAYERVSLPNLLLLLENRGLSVLNVSCHRCFGGGAFTSIHLWIEEASDNIVSCEALKEELVVMFEKAAEGSRSTPLLVNKEETISDHPTAVDPYATPWTYMPEPFEFYTKEN